MQAINILGPLLVFPYLIRVLGSDVYGKLIYSQALVAYMLLLVSFGFELSGAKSASINRDDVMKLSEIFSSVFVIKILIILIIYILINPIFYFLQVSTELRWIIICYSWMFFSDLLFPKWYFQGIEKMKYITVITLVSRLLFIVSIFLYVKSTEDYLLVPVLGGLSAFVSGAISMYIILIKHKLKFYIPGMRVIKQYVIDSAQVFTSTIAANIYKGSNRLIIGQAFGMSEVAYYDLADKIILLAKMPQNIFSQSVFPMVSAERRRPFVLKMAGVLLLMNLVISLILFIFSTQISSITGGPDMLNASAVIRILGIGLIATALSTAFGVQGLLGFGHNNLFTKSLIYGVLCYVLIVLILYKTNLMSVISISYATIITEYIAGFIMLKSWLMIGEIENKIV